MEDLTKLWLDICNQLTPQMVYTCCPLQYRCTLIFGLKAKRHNSKFLGSLREGNLNGNIGLNWQSPIFQGVSHVCWDFLAGLAFLIGFFLYWSSPLKHEVHSHMNSASVCVFYLLPLITQVQVLQTSKNPISYILVVEYFVDSLPVSNWQRQISKCMWCLILWVWPLHK